ncbi:hypothetical protein M8C21_015351 [Ambrosia artemisiifolia]|uniref:Uncharacterized protein n=1 Tax=Ambrosia artemisiifolia TaxID=4212 RepID=A0AAD5BZZ2_AMBAR|nr:hypothetical protein M8C21_015351 [Ambrosia artemisiifolia]
MASILKGGGLALSLIILIVASSTFDTISLADARTHARQLANRCQDPGQSDLRGCGGGGGGKGKGGSGGQSPRPGISHGPSPGSSHCKKGCCGMSKKQLCECCK